MLCAVVSSSLSFEVSVLRREDGCDDDEDMVKEMMMDGCLQMVDLRLKK